MVGAQVRNLYVVRMAVWCAVEGMNASIELRFASAEEH